MRGCIVLTVFLSVCGASAAVAQEVTYGATAGISLSTLSFDPSSEAEYGFRTGLVAGAFATWPLGSRLAIQPEGLFTQKGAKLDEAGIDATIKIDYLEVPVLVKYAITGGDRAWHVFGGPSVAFKLRSSSSATFGGSTVETDNDESIEDVDYGVVMGVGLDVGRFTVNGRFTLGLGNINADDSDILKARTRTLAFLAGVRF